MRPLPRSLPRSLSLAISGAAVILAAAAVPVTAALAAPSPQHFPTLLTQQASHQTGTGR